MTSLSASPNKYQFVSNLSSASPKAEISLGDVLNLDVARNFASDYYIRLVAFSTDNADILAGRLMPLISVKMLDGRCLFPLSINSVPSSVDLFTSVDLLANNYANIKIYLEFIDPPPTATNVKLLFDISKE